MRLTSSAFAEGQHIPAQYTCAGENISPPLHFENVPDGTVTLAVVCDSPDSTKGVQDHWLLFNLPAEHTDLPEGIASCFDPLPKACHGKNSWQHSWYTGPCQPNGKQRYYFTLYALDCRLALKGGAAKSHIIRAMEGHILATASLKGTYEAG